MKPRYKIRWVSRVKPQRIKGPNRLAYIYWFRVKVGVSIT